MPIYEYTCPKCGTFELIQRADDKPVKANPECQHSDCPKQAQRSISAAAFHLKGGGWYKDGYGTGKKTSETKTESSGGDSSSTKSDSTKNAKSDAPSNSGGCGSGKCGCH